MKPIRVPNNLFAACSLAKILEVFSLRKDAHRVDSAIAQHFFTRPIYLVEVETLWNCLGEESKYVYGCIKAFNEQRPTGTGPEVSERLEDLGTRLPQLYARICDPTANESYKPQFGRRWFGSIGSHGDEAKVTSQEEESFQAMIFERPVRHVSQPVDSTWRSPDSKIPTPNTKTLNPSAGDFKPMGTHSPIQLF